MVGSEVKLPADSVGRIISGNAACRLVDHLATLYFLLLDSHHASPIQTMKLQQAKAVMISNWTSAKIVRLVPTNCK